MTAALIACHECDLLQREVVLPAPGPALCARCGAQLYRSDPGSLDRALAFATAGSILFVMANAFPLVGLRISGELIETTLAGASRALYADGWRMLGAIVFITTIAAPLIELGAMMYLLVSLRFGKLPAGGTTLFRTLRAVQPWRMAEVMMLGILVALVKLAHMAEVTLGVALWSLAGLVIMIAACVATFDPRELWERVGVAR